MGKKIKKTLIIIILLSLTFFITTYFLVVNPVFFVEKSIVVLKINKDQLERDVSVMTGIEPTRNYKNIDSLSMIASWIEDRFETYNCELTIQEFKVENEKYRNISCLFGPVKSERVVVGAHYDVHGSQVGADDNASGVAGLLELGRLLNEEKNNLNHSIELVAYTLEELPFFKTKNMGSSVHADSLYFGRVNVKVMIALDMIGYYSDKEKSQNYPFSLMKLFYPTKGDFIAVVGRMGHHTIVKEVKKEMMKSEINVVSINAPRSIPGIDFSDHLNYWNRGYEAVMITDTAFYRNSNYHKTSDTIEILNFDKMAETIKGVYFTMLNI